jgi:hypothetical protein
MIPVQKKIALLNTCMSIRKADGNIDTGLVHSHKFLGIKSVNEWLEART